MARTALGDDKWQRIYERVQAGEMLRDLDREFGYSDGTVARMLNRRFGFARRPRKPSMARAQSDQLYQRLLAGESVSTLATELGMENNSNLYNLMRSRYGYEAVRARRAVWGPTVTKPPTGTDAAYMAGIIDGEGSIMECNRTKTLPTWTVKVGMTDRPVMEWLYSFGGSWSVRPAAPKRKEFYIWTVTRQVDVQLILSAVLPYLRVKRHLAVDALTFFDTADPFTRKWNRGDGSQRNPRGHITSPPST